MWVFVARLGFHKQMHIERQLTKLFSSIIETNYFIATKIVFVESVHHTKLLSLIYTYFKTKENKVGEAGNFVGSLTKHIE